MKRGELIFKLVKLPRLEVHSELGETLEVFQCVFLEHCYVLTDDVLILHFGGWLGLLNCFRELAFEDLVDDDVILLCVDLRVVLRDDIVLGVHTVATDTGYLELIDPSHLQGG